MRSVLDAIVQSSETGEWVKVELEQQPENRPF